MGAPHGRAIRQKQSPGLLAKSRLTGEVLLYWEVVPVAGGFGQTDCAGSAICCVAPVGGGAGHGDWEGDACCCAAPVGGVAGHTVSAGDVCCCAAAGVAFGPTTIRVGVDDGGFCAATFGFGLGLGCAAAGFAASAEAGGAVVVSSA